MRRIVLGTLISALAFGCAGTDERRPAADGEPDAPVETITCEGLSANCNGVAEDGCEVDLASDGSHCGECGRSCDGGLCSNGECGAAAELVASEQDGVCGLAADDENVFWTNCRSGTVASIPVAGGPSQVLASGQGWTYAFMLDEANVYWSRERGGVCRMPKSGGTVEVVYAEDDIWGLAVDADRIYWSRHMLRDDGTAYGAVMSGAKSGGLPVIVTLSPATIVTIDDTAVFWVNPEANQIQTVDKKGGSGASPTVLATTVGPVGALVARDGMVYWTQQGGLFRVPRTGGTPTSIDSGAESLDFDSSGVLYYQSGRELVAWTEARGRTPLAWLESGSVGGVASAGSFVYWGNFNTNDVSLVRR